MNTVEFFLKWFLKRFQKARKKAWASIMSDPEVAALIKEQRDAKLDKVLKLRDKVIKVDFLGVQKRSICYFKTGLSFHIKVRT